MYLCLFLPLLDVFCFWNSTVKFRALCGVLSDGNVSWPSTLKTKPYNKPYNWSNAFYWHFILPGYFADRSHFYIFLDHNFAGSSQFEFLVPETRVLRSVNCGQILQHAKRRFNKTSLIIKIYMKDFENKTFCYSEWFQLVRPRDFLPLFWLAMKHQFLSSLV